MCSWHLKFNGKVKTQFNQHYGVVNGQFRVADSIHIRTYNGQRNWKQATIFVRKAEVLHTIFILELQLQVVRYAN